MSLSGWDQSLVGVEAPPMFWSDFQSIQRAPEPSTNTRGSIDPPWSSWQMKGAGRARKGPVGAFPNASPMHWVAGSDPFSIAVK